MPRGWGIQPELGRLRVLRPGRWVVARSIGWAVVLTFGIVLAFGPAMEALASVLPRKPSYEFLAQVFGAALVLGSYALLVKIGEARNPSEIDPRAAPGGLAVGLVIGFAAFSLVMAILIGCGFYRFEFHGAVPAWRGAGLAIQSGILEEILVRGVILRLTWRAFGPVPAFIISSILFGAGHFGNPSATWFSTVCIAIEAGVLLGAFYALSGRLWIPIGVHIGWNFTQGYLFGSIVSGGDFGDAIATSAPNVGFSHLLTGGTFGPEASLPALLVCVTLGATVLWLAMRSDRFVRPAMHASQVEFENAALPPFSAEGATQPSAR